MTILKSGLIGLGVAALIGLGATPVNAQPIPAVLNLAGTITAGTAGSGAPVAPFSTGDRLTGTIDLDSGLLAPGTAFGINAFDNFDATVGPVEFSAASPGSLSLFGQVSQDGASASIFNLSTGQGLSTGCPTCSLTLATGAVQSLEVDNSGAAALGTLQTPRFTNPVSAPRSTAVPAPPTFALFGVALPGLILIARRKQKMAALKTAHV